jgi:hypothetical protein
MIKTRQDVDDLAADEVCIVCDGTRVRAVEVRWFVIELDRDDDLRDGELRRDTRSLDELYEDEPGLEFHCLSCGISWT